MERHPLNTAIGMAIRDGVCEASGSTATVEFSKAWIAYEQGLTIISLHTGNEYQKDLEYYDDPDSETGKSLDVTAWFIPDEIRGPWAIKGGEISKTFRVTFLLLGAYDVTFAISGRDEPHAEQNGIEEMKQNGIYKEPCELTEIHIMH